MKKILFSFMSLMLCGFMAQAQLTGTVTGQVLDSLQQPVPGVAVFFYGTSMEHGSQHWANPNLGLTVDKSNYKNHTYTNGNGQYSINYYVPNNVDTVVIGVVDCNQNVVFNLRNPSSTSPNYSANLMVSCAPTSCEAVLSVDSMSWNPGNSMFEYTAVALRDSGYGGPLGTVTHTWSYNGITRNGGTLNYGPNEDTIWVFSNTNPGQVCYQRSASCAPTCIGTNTPTPSGHSCNADFFVDSVNSINFQGQIVVWENSTTDSMANIIGYRWDFGDGSPIVNQRYPSHTYADTGVYEVCLTIISVEQTATSLDTCVSTHCDSIGFDSQGNLIYKSSGPGFTINVVDPATVGQSEVDLASHYKLFPNPTSGEATLSWDSEMQVERIDIFSVSGQVVKSIEPSSTSVSLNDMKTGVYIIRVSGDQGDTTLRMIVQ